MTTQNQTQTAQAPATNQADLEAKIAELEARLKIAELEARLAKTKADKAEEETETTIVVKEEREEETPLQRKYRQRSEAFYGSNHRSDYGRGVGSTTTNNSSRPWVSAAFVIGGAFSIG